MKKRQETCEFIVAIVSKGRGEDASLLLNDIRSQNIPPKKLIFVESVVDDKFFSKKNIQKIVGTSKIEVIYKSVNFSNIPRSRNVVLDTAKGKWLVFLDNDVRVEPDYLEKIQKIITKIDNPWAIVGRIIPTKVTWLSSYWSYVFCQGRSDEKNIKQIDFYSTLATTINMEMVKKYGFRFDKRLLTGEDTDFFLTATEKNLKLYYCPELIVKHNFESRSWTNTIKKFYEYGKYFMLIKSKHQKLFNVPCIFPKNSFEKFILPILILRYSFKIIDYIPRRFWPMAWVTHIAMILGVYSSLNKGNANKYV